MTVQERIAQARAEGLLVEEFGTNGCNGTIIWISEREGVEHDPITAKVRGVDWMEFDVTDRDELNVWFTYREPERHGHYRGGIHRIPKAA